MAEKSPDAGAEERFSALIKEHGALLRNTIVRLCPRDMGIEFDDIEQEARVRLWRGIQGEKEIRDAASYIYRIAVTTTIDAIRRAKARREEQLSLPEEGDEAVGQVQPTASPDDRPDRVAARRQIFEKIQRVLSTLAADRRRAVALHLQGMTTLEIGELMGWSEAKARNLAYRGLADLRERLRAEGIEYETE